MLKFKSIASRIILSVVPLVALFTILYLTVTFMATNRQINAQFNERMQESLKAAWLSMETELTANAAIAKSMAVYAATSRLDSIEHGVMRGFILRIIPTNHSTVGGGIWYEPYKLYQDQEYYAEYVFIQDSGAVWVGAYADEVNYFQEQWYINGKNSSGETVWSDVYYDPVADVTMITASVPFYNRNGIFLGVATADMALTDIQAISAAIAVGRTGQAFILGSNGEFISFFDQNRSIDQLIVEDQNPELARLGEAVLASSNGSTSIAWNGGTYRAFFSQLEATGWHLVVMIDTAEVTRSTYELMLHMAVVPLIGLALITLSIIFVSRRLGRVADKVNRFADRAASGDLSERIEISEHDEFGIMEDRLNKMMNNMAEMTERNAESLVAAQAANRAKTMFLSNMSHEVRTPMNAIIGMVQVARQTEDQDRIRACLDKIHTASHNLLDLINNVLDMAKIEANKIELEIKAFSIRETLRALAEVFEIKAEQKQLALDFVVDDAIPDRIWSDRFRYSQILSNLLSNAAKFTPEGGSIIVTVRKLEQNNDKLVLETSVRDTGIGINQAATTNLFDSFQQADSSVSRKYGGSGLGLSISKSLSELLCGTIWYEPNPGGGSCFAFTIQVDSAGSEPEQQPSAISPEQYDFSGKTILLAEDVEINREIVCALLEPTNIAVDCAENGLQACELYTTHPERYSLIFMDIQMPEMDGLSAARAIRKLETGRQIPIVALSANAFRDDVEASLDAGMNAHLSKPVVQAQLLETLASFLA